ncbi:MAG TPA: (4Fe-4S)-binding protein [Flavipsychrobacter sp.]|nr:(4Fe-4S)-binding protein [Flavipsychrobacter sp.]
MKNITKEYSNGEVTVVWKPDSCIHSAICIRGLPQVFNTKASPWVNIQGADTDAIVKQVEACPSGALSYYRNGGEVPGATKTDVDTVVEMMKNGPLMVYGNISVKTKDGSVERKHKVTAFCRCGASQNKPFCDGSHVKIGFKDE